MKNFKLFFENMIHIPLKTRLVQTAVQFVIYSKGNKK